MTRKREALTNRCVGSDFALLSDRRCLRMPLVLKLPSRPRAHTTLALYYEKQCLYLRIIISHCICICNCIYIYCNAQWAQLPMCVSCAGRRRHIWRSCEAPQACTLQPAVFLFFVFCICLLVFLYCVFI